MHALNKTSVFGLGVYQALVGCSRSGYHSFSFSLMMQDLQDSSEEDGGDGNEYDTTDRFLVADDAAEDEEGEGGEEDAAQRRRKRRRRREEDEELDEEDYELIVSLSWPSRLHRMCQELKHAPLLFQTSPVLSPYDTHRGVFLMDKGVMR